MWSGLPLPVVSPCPLCTGPVWNVTWLNSGGCKPTSALLYTSIKCYCYTHTQGNNLSGDIFIFSEIMSLFKKMT